jgi:hypothetical protein
MTAHLATGREQQNAAVEGRSPSFIGFPFSAEAVKFFF